MNLPFTVEQFLTLFQKYNEAIWPMQVIAYVLAGVVLLFLAKKVPQSHRFISAVLACFWFWMGAVYHLRYFSEINQAANIFGILFLLQGLLFLFYGLIKGDIVFDYKYDIYTMIGAVLILFGMFVYTAIGLQLGHIYPRAPIFGVAPCPTTIFTFGLLLLTKKLPKVVLVVPLLWSIIGFFAAIKLGIKEDFGLLIAGVIGTIMILIRDRVKAESEV